MQGTVRLARCFSSVNIFQQADFNFSGTVRHFTLQYLTPSLEKFGNELNKRTLHTERSGNGDSQKGLHFITTFCKGSSKWQCWPSWCCFDRCGISCTSNDYKTLVDFYYELTYFEYRILSVFYFVRFCSCLVTNNRPHTFRIISCVLFNNSSEQMLFIPCRSLTVYVISSVYKTAAVSPFTFAETLAREGWISEICADIFAKLSTREYLNAIHVTVEKQSCLGYVANCKPCHYLYPIVCM